MELCVLGYRSMKSRSQAIVDNDILDIIKERAAKYGGKLQFDRNGVVMAPVSWFEYNVAYTRRTSAPLWRLITNAIPYSIDSHMTYTDGNTCNLKIDNLGVPVKQSQTPEGCTEYLE
jgi:uncharacterized protein YkuJ